MTSLTRLKELAEQATQQWEGTVKFLPDCTMCGAGPEHPVTYGGKFHSPGSTEAERDAEFIASANPQTVLALLESIDDLKKALEKIAKPRSMVMSGDDDIEESDELYEEFEELYDFWHWVSSDNLNAAVEALSALRERWKE